MPPETTIAQQPQYKDIKTTGLIGMVLGIFQLAALVFVWLAVSELKLTPAIVIGQLIFSSLLMFVAMRILMSKRVREVQNLLSVLMGFSVINIALILFSGSEASILGMVFYVLLLGMSVRAKKQLKTGV